MRVSTSGPSAIVDPAGRMVDRIPFGTAGVVRASIEPRTEPTPYGTIGDAFAWGCVLLTLGLQVAIGKKRQ